MTRARRCMVAASLAALVATSALAAGATTVAPLVRVSGKSPYAKCGNDGIAENVVFDNADSEARLAASPVDANDLVGVWTQDVSDLGGGRGIMSSWSNDGGATWHGVKVPVTKCNTPPTDYARAFAPWVSVGAGGQAYVASAVDAQGSGTNPSAIAVNTSSDGGHTWAAPKFVGRTTGSFNDFVWTWHATVAASPTVAGRAYLVFDRWHVDVGGGGPGTYETFVSRTTDAGAHWSAAKRLDAVGGAPSGGHTVLVDPSSGAVYVVWTQATKGGAVARLVVSADGANTWSSVRTINTVQAVPVRHPVTGEAVASAFTADVAIDPGSGALYAVWADARNTGGRRDEILFSRSTNGGVSWSKVVRVSSIVKRPAFLPTVAVNGTGTVGVLYYDIRFMKAGDAANLRTDVWLRTSADGGRTWSGDKHAGGPFNMRAAPKTDSSAGLRFTVGVYQGLGANAAGNFVPFFVQTNCVTGGCPSNRTDVFASVVAP